ncbi:MAG: TfoX/Sxy family protein [Planctomycetaceae bacterium]|nr:TfoX/Sxy family protein [Planctomycetaceae bacterium]
MRNLGPKSRKLLNQIGIHSRENLQQLGAVAVYLKLREQHSDVTLNMLWALQGAILDCHWNDLPLEMKSELKQQVSEALS